MATIKKVIKKARTGTSTSKWVPSQDKGQYDTTSRGPIVSSTEGNKKIRKSKTEFTKGGFSAGTRNVRTMENPKAKVNDTISSFRNKTDITDKTFLGKTDRSRYSIKKPGGVETVESSTAQIGGIPNTVSKKTFTKNKTGGAVKKTMRNGGSLSGLKASNKRVGPVDPNGAFTKVQKKTLAGAKGKAKLTKDKQLGATKMAKCGTKMSKK